MTNVSSITCQVGGYPTLIGITPSGVHVPLVAQHGTYFGDRVPTDLAPGVAAELYLETDDGCPALNNPNPQPEATANTYSGLIVDLAGNHGILVVTGLTLDTACGLSESQIGAQPSTTTVPTPTPGSLASLEARAEFPAEVRAGSILDYDVVLTNPTTRPVSLTPCPEYTEGLGGLVTRSYRFIQHSYRLNCAPVHAISPGASVTFAMELAVPADLAPGSVKRSWELDTGSGPYLGGAFQVAR